MSLGNVSKPVRSVRLCLLSAPCWCGSALCFMAPGDAEVSTARIKRSLLQACRTGKQAVKVVLLAVAVGVYFIPSPTEPEPLIFEGSPPALEGSLAFNTRLQRGQRLFAGQLKGPESFTADQNGADGIPFDFLNGLEISKNGTVFFTDSSRGGDGMFVTRC
ncbi:hypothetical protein MHYP_G00317270 [Metynnis hypsauchen]